MKILICTHTYLPDVNGVSIAVNNQYKLLKNLGHDVSILSSKKSKFYPEIIESFDIKGSGRLFDPFSGATREYIKYLDKSNYQVVFFHCWETYITELALQLKNVSFKKVLFSHGTSQTMYGPKFKSFLRRVIYLPYYFSFTKRMNFFDHYVFLTQAGNRDRFLDKLYFDQNSKKNFSIIPNIINILTDTGKVNIINRFQLPSKKIILCVSNFSKMKGQDVALQAFSRIRQESHILVFIGSEDNLYSKKLKDSYRELIGKSVFFFNDLSRDEISSFYFYSDFFILCSKTEAQPLVILESIANKLPFICSNVGCVSLLKGGLVYDTADKLLYCISKLIHDQKYKDDLRHEAYNEYLLNYSGEVIKSKYEELLKKLC